MLTRAEWYRENDARLAVSVHKRFAGAQMINLAATEYITGIPSRKLRKFIFDKTGVRGMEEGKHVYYDKAVIYAATKETRT